jgi:hypothetical protein
MITTNVLDLIKPGSPNHKYGNTGKLIGKHVRLTKAWSGLAAGYAVEIVDINLTPGSYVVTAKDDEGKSHFFPAAYLQPFDEAEQEAIDRLFNLPVSAYSAARGPL